MHDSYLTVGGTEVINKARTAHYIRTFLPQVEVTCDEDTLAEALGHQPYLSPAEDGAPWVLSNRPAGERFYGLFPGKIQGAEDSTQEISSTELSGDGAVTTAPRYGSREIRFVVTALAADQEAMEEGMAWLRSTLANEGCSDADMNCGGQTIGMFVAPPEDNLAAYHLTRTFHQVNISEGPLVKQKFPTKGFVMWQIEWTLRADIPWAFTSLAEVGLLDMDAALNYQDPAWENCSVEINAYDDFVTDPYYTGISRPPRPPVILPPNILSITSWRRRTLRIPPTHTERWGRTVPLVRVVTEATEAQYLRLRFYRESAGASGCDYDGEFLISYLPANTVLTLDGVTRQATMRLPDGRTVPATHLLFGSAGRPFLWPTLGCQHEYTMTADLMPGQAGVAVELETSVRE